MNPGQLDKNQFSEKEPNDPCNDIRKCLELVQLIVDGEASQEQQDYFQKHIEECITCLENYKLDIEIKKSLRNKVPKVEVPSDLVDSILNKIKQVY